MDADYRLKKCTLPTHHVFLTLFSIIITIFNNFLPPNLLKSTLSIIPTTLNNFHFSVF